MIPKMNAPNRMRSGHGMSGVSNCRSPEPDDSRRTRGASVALPLELRDDGRDAVLDALVVVARLERGRHHGPDDLAARPSVSVGSRPYPTSIRILRSSGTTTTSTPLSFPFCPSFQLSNTFTA